MPRRFSTRNRRPRAPMRKWVWARTHGALLPEVAAGGANLLAPFQEEYGAQLLGSTVMRIRGYLQPFYTGGGAEGVGQSAVGIIVEEDDELTEGGGTGNQPFERPHDDWLAWLPYAVPLNDPGPQGNGLTVVS